MLAMAGNWLFLAAACAHFQNLVVQFESVHKLKWRQRAIDRYGEKGERIYCMSSRQLC